MTDSEECEEAYGELLSLYDARKQQSSPQQSVSAGDGVFILLAAKGTQTLTCTIYGFQACIRHSWVLSFPPSSEAVGDSQDPESPLAQRRKMGTEELSTSFSTAGVTEETETPSHTGQR